MVKKTSATESDGNTIKSIIIPRPTLSSESTGTSEKSAEDLVAAAESKLTLVTLPTQD